MCLVAVFVAKLVETGTYAGDEDDDVLFDDMVDDYEDEDEAIDAVSSRHLQCNLGYLNTFIQYSDSGSLVILFNPHQKYILAICIIEGFQITEVEITTIILTHVRVPIHW